MKTDTRTAISKLKVPSLSRRLALILSFLTISLSSAHAQDVVVSRPFVQAYGATIRAFDAQAALTHEFAIPSVEAYGEIHDVVRLPDGRFIAFASTYYSPYAMIICTATSSRSADCDERPVQPGVFPARFALLGNGIFYNSLGSKDFPGKGIVRFDLTNYTTTLLPLEVGKLAAGQDGLLYVYQHSRTTITAIDPNSLAKIREVSLPIGEQDFPDSIAVDAKGNMYFENGLWKGYLIKFDPQGKIINTATFPGSIFSFRNSSDGYLLVNVLFQDDSNPSYPFRWETSLLNSDLEIQWTRKLGRSRVSAIVEMECVRSPITLKAVKNGEPKRNGATLSQEFTVTVRNNDSTLCGEQPVRLDISSTAHSANLGVTGATLQPGESFSTKLRIEAPSTFSGTSNVELQARGERSLEATKRKLTFDMYSPTSPAESQLDKTPQTPSSSCTTPSAPKGLKLSKKDRRAFFTWKASASCIKVRKYLVYVDGGFLSTVAGTKYRLPASLKLKGVHTLSIRALDERNTMSEEARLKFFK